MVANNQRKAAALKSKARLEATIKSAMKSFKIVENEIAVWKKKAANRKAFRIANL